MKGVRRFDLYRKVPRDLSEPTASGACVSCCTVAVALYLFINEALVFSRHTWSSEMFIDDSKTEEKLQVNLDITLPACPCELLSFDALDVMGSHEVDAHGNLYKERLTSKGDVIGVDRIQGSRYGAQAGLTRHYSFGYDSGDVDRIRKMVNSGEGCRVYGFVRVNSVPGNVHLSTYSHSYLMGSLYDQSASQNINISHVVNHISFGTDADISYVKSNFPDTGVVSPLDGTRQHVGEKTTTTLEPGKTTVPDRYGAYLDLGSTNTLDSGIFEYYAKVVPTTYVPKGAPPINVYQFTASANKIPNQQLPSIYLRYDFSPVTVLYTEERESLHAFVVKICAVVGGVFTIAGLMDGLLHRGMVRLAKSVRASKLRQ